jgi:hypothetical protein
MRWIAEIALSLVVTSAHHTAAQRVSKLLASDQVASQRGAAKTEHPCWTDGEELINPDRTKRAPILLPKHLWNAKVKMPGVGIKLCIDASGKVVRSFVVESSSNNEVDEYFRSEWSKVSFKPLLKSGKPVRSVVTMRSQWTPS